MMLIITLEFTNDKTVVPLAFCKKESRKTLVFRDLSRGADRI
ncbi:hypothetical protein RUMTOR_01436 [[Ruminococcus] torques ATCC 27756]|uniref:Uncharacterized protein n=1 Tax=[Ruminococcus] torques ATCC 27756 TaxID=411460 RepID=A5KMG2_9FIRM|nr:hypothetical protein RUMTOR_01436 [[Ruminococcus] torques ATCC 27756]